VLHLFHNRAKFDARKKSKNQVILRYVVKHAYPSIVSILYVFEKVYNVVGFSEIIFDVVIFGRDAEFYKLIFKRSALLEKTVNLTFDFHLYFLVVLKSVPAVMALRVEARRFTRLRWHQLVQLFLCRLVAWAVG
jgi:hypothetical protein